KTGNPPEKTRALCEEAAGPQARAARPDETSPGKTCSGQARAGDARAAAPCSTARDDARTDGRIADGRTSRAVSSAGRRGITFVSARCKVHGARFAGRFMVREPGATCEPWTMHHEPGTYGEANRSRGAPS